MWIFLGIVGGLAALIFIIAMLPLNVIIKNDENNNFLLHYRFLGKLYGELPDPTSPILLQLKKSSGVARIEKQLADGKLTNTTKEEIKELLKIIGDLLRELAGILKHCTAKIFRIHVVCYRENAADTAIAFGRTSSLVYGFATGIENVMRVRKRGRDVRVDCDFSGEKKTMRYEFVIMVRFGRVLGALWRLAMEEIRREKREETQS